VQGAKDSASRGISPALALAIGVLAVSTGALFVRLAEAPALPVAFWRTALAALLLLPFGARPLARWVASATRADRLLVVASGLFLALHFAAWIRSLGLTSVAASVVLVNTTPLWAGLLTPLVARERVSRATAIGIAASVTGAAVIGAADFELSGRALAGDALALLGALAATAYFFAGRRLRPKLDLVPYVLACYGTAALFLLAFVLVSGEPLFAHPPRSYLCFLALALVPQLLGHTSYNYALRWVGAALVAVAQVGECFGSALLAWWILRERPAAAAVLGAGLILAGIAWAALGERRGSAPSRANG